MRKIIIIIGSIAIIFLAVIVLYKGFIRSYTPTLKERSDFTFDEIQIIEGELFFKLYGQAKIVKSRYTHAKESVFLLWIDGIADKKEFVEGNSLELEGQGSYYVGDNEKQNAEYYTSSEKQNIKWYLYEKGSVWSVYVINTYVTSDIRSLFDKAENYYK